VLSIVRSMARPQSVTLEEVAARAGVSPGTVSRVLNGKNKENRPAIARKSDRIRHIALQLGYRPNVAARSMLSGRFGAVGFVTCGDLGKDWYPISGLNGIHAELEKSEFRLMFTELPASKINNPELVPQLFREASVDGLLVNLLPFFSEDLVDYFEAQPLPCVWLNLKRKLRSVYPDELSGSALGVRWLAEKGHKKIGFFTRVFASPTHYSVMDRFSGFTAAMKTLGLPFTRHLELIGSSTASKTPVLARAELYLSTFPDVEAVVCYEYEEAVCLTLAAERLGRRVPDDLEIIGFNEREIRSSSGLSIPTIIVPFHEVGRRAVLMLQAILDTHDREQPSVAVPFSSILV
jgi:LacI family transcriptional regulator